MSQKFIFAPENPHLDQVKANAHRAIDEAGTKRAEVMELKRLAKPRSNPQNRTLWGVVYPPLMEHMGLQGERDREDLHEFWCGEFFGWRDVPMLGGKAKQRPIRTTTTDEDGRRSILSTLEFQEFVEFIRTEASKRAGVFIPDPIPNYIRELEARGEA